MYKILLLVFFSFLALDLFAQPTIDGNMNDASYTTIATYTSGRDGGGANVKLGSINYDKDGNYLYIGITGEPRQGFGGLILILDFSAISGRGTNTLRGTSSGGVAGFGGGLANLIMDAGFDADFGFELCKTWSATDSYLNAIRFQSGSAGYAISGGIGGNLGQTGTAIDVPCASGTGGTGNITVAFRNSFSSGGNNYGLEMRIPYSALPGVTADQTVKMFVMVNGDYDHTAPFNECMPGDPGPSNLTTNFDFSSVAGQQFYTDPVSVLPVELTSFTAVELNGSVTLNWQTATEVNNYGFEVERSEVGSQKSEWINIGFVQGSGNSNSPKEYTYVDENPPAGNLQYRLKQIDTDGKFEYYGTIAEVNLSPTGVEEVNLPNEFKLSQNFPNPFNPVTVISYQLPVNGQVELKVYDILGNEIAVLVNEMKAAGYYEIKFDGSNLSSGIYFYKLQSGSFSGIKKFILMK